MATDTTYTLTLNNLGGTLDYTTTIDIEWRGFGLGWDVTATIGDNEPRDCGHIASDFNGFKDLETAAAEAAFETLILPLETNNSKGTN